MSLSEGVIIMNTLLELYTAKLAYEKGKETGLAGLVGIIVIVAIVALWQYIEPVLEFIGLMGLLDNLGLIYHGEPGITWFRIFGWCLAAYMVAIVVFLTLMLVVFLLTAIVNTKIGKWLGTNLALAFFLILLSPLLLVLIPLLLITGVFELISFLSNPSQYKVDKREEKRTKKNQLELSLTREDGIKEPPALTQEERIKEIASQCAAEAKGIPYVPKRKQYKEHNEIQLQEVIDRNNRLPIVDEAPTLIGVTYDREFYIILPKPSTLSYKYRRADTFFVRKINVKAKWNTEIGNYKLSVSDEDDSYKFDMFDYEQFEYFFDVEDSSAFLSACRTYSSNKPYKYYVKEIQSAYYELKEELTNAILDTVLNKEQKYLYEQHLNDLNALLVKNEPSNVTS